MIRFAIPLLLLTVPLAEIALFVAIGGRIGVLATIALIVLTAIIGTFLLRLQGLQVLAEAKKSADEGKMPLGPVIDGLCLLVAGLLLITPGFLTDAVGFALFVPGFRRALARLAWRQIKDSAWVDLRQGRAGPAGQRPPGGEGSIIEGEIVDEHVPGKGGGADDRDSIGSPWQGNGTARK